MSELIANRGYCTKCGSETQSFYRHHFVKCECGEGYLDGGLDYIRTGGTMVSVPVYNTDAFKRVRKAFYRCGYGADGLGPWRVTHLNKMDDDYLDALLKYDCPDWQKDLVKREQQYRKQKLQWQ